MISQREFIVALFVERAESLAADLAHAERALPGIAEEVRRHIDHRRVAGTPDVVAGLAALRDGRVEPA